MATRKHKLTAHDAPLTPDDLKEWRRQLGWTQKDAASWFDYTEKGYQNWEQGKRQIHRPAAVRRQMELAKTRTRKRSA